MSRFRLRGYTDSTTPPQNEECDTADAALGIGRRLAARGLVVFAFVYRDDRQWQELALFVGSAMLPNRTLAPADNPLLALTRTDRASRPARRPQTAAACSTATGPGPGADAATDRSTAVPRPTGAPFAARRPSG